MLPEYILLAYAVGLGLLVKICSRRCLEYIAKKTRAPEQTITACAGRAFGLGLLFTVISVGAWAYLSSHYSIGDTDTLMKGISILTGIGISVVIPAFGILNASRNRDGS